MEDERMVWSDLPVGLSGRGLQRNWYWIVDWKRKHGQLSYLVRKIIYLFITRYMYN